MSTFIIFGGGPVGSAIANGKTTTIQDNCKPGNSWKIVLPQASYNYVKNPSAETTGNFDYINTPGVVSRSNAYQKYGLYSYLMQMTVANDGIVLDLETLTNTTHFLTVRVMGDLPDLKAALDTGGETSLRFIERIDVSWILMGCSFPASVSDGAVQLGIYQAAGGLHDVYIDGIQLEPLPYWTTYCDGTQEGCSWSGTAHASYSLRSANTRAGGRVADFYDEFGFFIKSVVGAGTPPIELNIDEYAIIPGGEFNSEKIQPRQFTLVGEFYGSNEPDLHEKRQALELAFSSASIPGKQPVKLIFSGSKVQKEISVRYKGGLEGDLAAFYNSFQAGDDRWTKLQMFNEKASIQLVATDPFWYEIGESAVLLQPSNSATFRFVAFKNYSTGLWDNAGPPDAGGTYVGGVYTIAEDENYIYLGGDFQNFDDIANADRIVRYEKATGTYSAMGTGADNTVHTIVIGPDGFVYAGGAFTSMGGVADTSCIAYWDGAVWNPLDVGANSTVYGLAFDSTGILYAVGGFFSIGGVATTGIASWDGINWAVVGGSTNGDAMCIDIDLDTNYVYIGGIFTDVNGVGANYAAYWDGGAWNALDSGFDSTVHVIRVLPDGHVLFGGNFTTAGGVGVSYIALWTGAGFLPLGSGTDDQVLSLALGSDGYIYAGGLFNSAGGLALADSIARWNGYTWSHTDINLPGGGTSVRAILTSRYTNDIWIGFTDTGTGYYASITSVYNEGTALAFPKIIYSRSGGSLAVIELLTNLTDLRKDLLLNYSLKTNETLTINLTPAIKSITSSLYGSKLSAILPNSSFGLWTLLPKNNDITSFFNVSGGTTQAYMLWRDAYKAYD